jgi:predicted lysophospholipase L1 biosynthesis ABC-type transport system permease subunit
MKEQLSAVRWKRVSLAIATGMVVIFGATTAYQRWRMRDWCVRHYPNGSEKVLYGSDCNIPK